NARPACTGAKPTQESEMQMTRSTANVVLSVAGIFVAVMTVNMIVAVINEPPKAPPPATMATQATAPATTSPAATEPAQTTQTTPPAADNKLSAYDEAVNRLRSYDQNDRRGHPMLIAKDATACRIFVTEAEPTDPKHQVPTQHEECIELQKYQV